MKKILPSILLFFCSFHLVKAQTQVTFYTTEGNFEAELYDSLSPITAGNFKSLVDSAFYDGIIFHRVIDNFVIQGGDPLGNGTGGPGYSIPDEFISGLSNVEKTLSMANAGPNTGGSQFFINLKNNTFLDWDKQPTSSAHPVFGIVYNGWPVCQIIESVPVNGNDKPLTDVVMDSVRVTGSILNVEEINQMETVTAVYPNPVSNQSVLDFYSQKNESLSIAIYNQTGALLNEFSAEVTSGKTLIPLSNLGLNSLENGVYYLIANDGKTSFSERIIVLH